MTTPVSGPKPRPGVTPPPVWTPPIPDEFTTATGLRIVTHDLPSQQVISIRTVLPVALADEPRAHEGVTVMLARLLDEGAGDLDAEAFALALERQGAALGAGAQDGGVSVDVDVPVRHLPAALRLLADALARPLFPEDEVRRVLRNRIAEYEHETTLAPHRAARALIAGLWAADDRASRPTAGTPETIGALDREAIAARHEALQPRGATVVVAGRLAGLDLPALIDDTLGRWDPPGCPEPVLAAPVPRADGTRIILIDRPGAVQSEFAIGADAPGRADPDWAAYPVLAYLLGGSPGARIDALLREDKGYTYGIRAALRPRARGGSFVISGSVRAEVTAEALDLLMGVLERARDGFAEAELAGGVDFLTRATPGRWATADAVADETAALALEGLGWDFPAHTAAARRALTPADLDGALARVSAAGWTIVVVGDAARTRASLDALGIGPLEVLPG